MSALIISYLLVSLLPSSVMDVANSALDSVGMTVEGMNFDRNWGNSVRLADSTVVSCIQDVWKLPQVADSVYNLAVDYEFMPVQGGVDSLVSVLCNHREDYLSVIESLSCADSLALLCSVMWAFEDSATISDQWGFLYSSRGFAIPFTEEEIELDLEQYTELLTRWQAVEPPSAELITGLIMGLEIPEESGTIQAPGVEGWVIDYSLDGDITWVIGDCGRNTYTGETRYDLIIDPGGDDLYLSGGDGIGVLGSPIGVIADLSGNDVYNSDMPVSQGSGFMGFGALIDLGGDDVYRGGSLSQGSAIMGFGLFVDMEGDDYKTADVHSQAAATLGQALLYDLSGNDVYKVSSYGQGFGGPGGTGNLVDGNGNDTYLAGFTYSHEPLLPQDNIAMAQGFGMGLRPFCAGGIGTLCDLGSGNDTYRAEVFGQGCAYFYSLGILFDAGGQDTYSSAQYSQGTGIHLASGILVDLSGDDQYVSRRGPAQGSAHDLSTGFLIDMEGDDYYATDGGHGLALTNSAAVFIDYSGSDVYALRGSGQGQASWARGSSGSGLFLDMADSDFYMGYGSDSSGWYREYSAGLDLSVISPVPEDQVEDIGDPESLDLDSLFVVASEWGVSGNRDRVLAHREELAFRGEKAVDFILMEHLDSWDGLEHRAIKKCFLVNSDYASEELLLLLSSDLKKRELNNVIQWLGEVAGESARLDLEEMLSDSSYQESVLTLIRTLGEIGHEQSLALIVSFAGSDRERVRRQVAVSLAEFDEIALSVLQTLLEDESLAVRSAARKSLDGINTNEQE